jgi:hypothetical protein
MSTSKPPFLEFGFYFRGCHGNKALARLYSYLVELGGQPSGAVDVHLGHSISDYGFATARDCEVAEVVAADHADVIGLLNNRNARVIRICVRGATGIIADGNEIVTQVDIDPRSAGRDCHPVAVQVDASTFLRSNGETNGHVHSIGASAFRFFRKAVCDLEPEYAAITVGSSLKSPMDLSFGATEETFRDFYLSGDFANQYCGQLIDRFARVAYVETIRKGLLIICSDAFRPDFGSSSISMVDELSVGVGTALSTAMAAAP